MSAKAIEHRRPTPTIVIARLDRATQYSRDADDKTEKPRHTGYPACAGFVLDHVPVAVRLAVFLSLGASQKHDAANLSASHRDWESGRSSLQPFLAETEDPTLCQ